MTKQYKIHSLSTDSYNYLIICLSYESIFSYIDQLVQELKNRGCNDCSILIDQLLISGNGRNRFLSLELSDGNLNFNSAKNVDAAQYYHQLTSNELRIDPKILDHSILTKRQISLISRGCTI